MRIHSETVMECRVPRKKPIENCELSIEDGELHLIFPPNSQLSILNLLSTI
jgi:hypothetical protein